MSIFNNPNYDKPDFMNNSYGKPFQPEKPFDNSFNNNGLDDIVSIDEPEKIDPPKKDMYGHTGYDTQRHNDEHGDYDITSEHEILHDEEIANISEIARGTDLIPENDRLPEISEEENSNPVIEPENNFENVTKKELSPLEEIEEAINAVSCKNNRPDNDYFSYQDFVKEANLRSKVEDRYPGINSEQKHLTGLLEERTQIHDKNIKEINEEISEKSNHIKWYEDVPAKARDIENDRRQINWLKDKRRDENVKFFRDTLDLKKQIAKIERTFDKFRDSRYRT